MSELENNQKDIRDGGHKATRQRLIILKVISQIEYQFTAQELFKTIHQSHPEIGLVTVYRSLEIFANTGLVCQMSNIGGSQTYIRSPAGHHHHLVCVGCKKVVDVDTCSLNALQEKLKSDTGFIINDHNLEFTGLCPGCQAPKSKVTWGGIK